MQQKGLQGVKQAFKDALDTIATGDLTTLVSTIKDITDSANAAAPSGMNGPNKAVILKSVTDMASVKQAFKDAITALEPNAPDTSALMQLVRDLANASNVAGYAAAVNQKNNVTNAPDKTSIANAAKTASASPSFKSAVDAASSAASNASELIALIQALPLTSCSLSSNGIEIISSLKDSRDINAVPIDATSTMDALAAIENIEKDKPYVLLVYNYDLSSYILSREFNKMKAMAISERQNASGSAYAVCQFMIAIPKLTNVTAKTTTYLAYQAK